MCLAILQIAMRFYQRYCMPARNNLLRPTLHASGTLQSRHAQQCAKAVIFFPGVVERTSCRPEFGLRPLRNAKSSRRSRRTVTTVKPIQTVNRSMRIPEFNTRRDADSSFCCTPTFDGISLILAREVLTFFYFKTDNHLNAMPHTDILPIVNKGATK